MKEVFLLLLLAAIDYRRRIPNYLLMVLLAIWLLLRRRVEGFGANENQPPVDLESVKMFNQFASSLLDGRVNGNLHVTGKLTVDQSIENDGSISSGGSITAAADLTGKKVTIDGLPLAKDEASGALATPRLLVDDALNNQTGTKPAIMTRNVVLTAKAEPANGHCHSEESWRRAFSAASYTTNVLNHLYIPAGSVTHVQRTPDDNHHNHSHQRWMGYKYQNEGNRPGNPTNPSVINYYSNYSGHDHISPIWMTGPHRCDSKAPR